MAVTNHQRIGQGLQELAAGLRPFLERELRAKFADDDSTEVRYLYDPFTGRAPEPGFGEHTRVLSWSDFWALVSPPH